MGPDMAQTVAVIGTGSMGGMLLRASARYSPGQFRLLAAGRNENALAALAAAVPSLRTGPARAVAGDADIVIVCVQPQNYLDVVAEIAPAMSDRAMLVSITNGIALDALAGKTSAPIVKVIPSVTHECGRGVSLVMRGPRATATDVAAVVAFFAPFSRPIEIPPAESRVATNITGCGPALLAFFAAKWMRANCERAVAIGDATLATMVAETFAATAAMVEAGTSLDAIARAAATGGGMTQIAIETLAAGLPELLDRMVDATIQRERALQNQQFNPHPTRKKGEQ